MARRTIPMIEVDEILYRWFKGMSERRISRSLGISRMTVRKILFQARQLGLGDEPQDADFTQLKSCLFELRQGTKMSSPAQDYLKVHHEQIESWRLMPYMTVTQMVRLFAEQGNKVSETSLRRYIRKHFPSLPDSTVHLETKPGRQAQVDFAFVGLMKDPLSEKMRKAYAFIMTLSHSRYRFVRFVFRQDVKTWIDCHIRAFHFFGGVPATIMPDNLKSGVITPDLYDPVLNRAYGELEKHYGFVCDPTKVRTPRHKGKVERSVTIVRQQVLAGRIFKDIEDANAHALHWCHHEIALKPTRTTGQAPWEIFMKEEKALLKPLPSEDYECPIWQELKVHRDHHVVFEGSFYSVPTQHIGKMVWMRASARIVDIYLNHQKIKTHVRSQTRGQWVTDPQDYPKHARAFLEKDKDHCLEQARLIGPSTYQFLSRVLKQPSLLHQRKAQAVLRLEEKYGSQRLEAACQRAMLFENDSYRSLKGILVQGLETQDAQKGIEIKSVLPRHASYLRGRHEFQPLMQGANS
jgi:transposase